MQAIGDISEEIKSPNKEWVLDRLAELEKADKE